MTVGRHASRSVSSGDDDDDDDDEGGDKEGDRIDAASR